jgi:hypothetical protein
MADQQFEDLWIVGFQTVEQAGNRLLWAFGWSGLEAEVNQGG